MDIKPLQKVSPNLPFKIKVTAFTLVELMMVIVVIMLLSAMAIPNLLRVRHNANEAAAQKALHTLVTAFEEYRAVQSPPAYPPGLATLANSVPAYIDSALGSGTRQGYSFAVTDVTSDTYTITATPVTPGVTGTRIFRVDQSSEITVDEGGGGGGGGCGRR